MEQTGKALENTAGPVKINYSCREELIIPLHSQNGNDSLALVSEQTQYRKNRWIGAGLSVCSLGW